MFIDNGGFEKRKEWLEKVYNQCEGNGIRQSKTQEFIKGVIDFNEKRGYITEKQQHAVADINDQNWHRLYSEAHPHKKGYRGDGGVDPDECYEYYDGIYF